MPRTSGSRTPQSPPRPAEARPLQDSEIVVADHHVGDAYTDMRRTRVTTEPVFEAAPEPAGAYERVFGGQGTGPEYTLEEDPRATVDHDPDDYSPWS